MNTLPNDLLLEICDYFDESSLGTIFSSCNLFNQVAASTWERRFNKLNFTKDNLLKIMYFAGFMKSSGKQSCVNLKQIYYISKQWDKQKIVDEDGDKFVYGTYMNAFIFHVLNPIAIEKYEKSKQEIFLSLVMYASEHNCKEVLFNDLVTAYDTTRPERTLVIPEFLLDSKLYASQLDLLKAQIHYNSIRCIRQWIELQYSIEFAESSPLSLLLSSFLKTLPLHDFTLLSNSIEDQTRRCLVPFLEPLEVPLKKFDSSVDNMQLLNYWSSREIAKQIALISQDMFFKLTYDEFLQGRSQRCNRDSKAPNVMNIVKFFNQTSNWVGAVIVSVKEDIVNNIVKFIEIANCAVEMGDFNSAFIIASGLQLAAVFRLKESWSVSF